MEDQVQETGVESVSEADSQDTQSEINTGVETKSEAGTEETNSEKAWAKRIAAERTKIEQEYADRYKDYDVYKEIAEYTKETSNFDDILSVKEAIELERLQQRAEKQQLPVEVQQRLEALEAKAAKADEFEKQQEEQKTYQEFRTNLLEPFAKDKGIDANELEKFMTDNQVYNLDMAYRAMKYEDVEAKREQIEKEAVKKFLEAKGSMTKVEGKTQTGQVIAGTAKNFTDARQRAMQRLQNTGMEG
jgi:hypothetical protein